MYEYKIAKFGSNTPPYDTIRGAARELYTAVQHFLDNRNDDTAEFEFLDSAAYTGFHSTVLAFQVTIKAATGKKPSLNSMRVTEQIIPAGIEANIFPPELTMETAMAFDDDGMLYQVNDETFLTQDE